MLPWTALVGALVLGMPALAQAQAYPNRPISFVVPFMMASRFVLIVGDPERDSLKLAADGPVERIRPAATQRDREGDDAPQQGVFVTAIEP